jgi:hypothetical protein
MMMSFARFSGRSGRRLTVTALACVFILPLAISAGLFAFENRPGSWHQADWSSAGLLPPAASERDARIVMFVGRTGRWKGVVAVHTWIVLKPENGATWRRYDVVGWGNPVRVNGWDPDGRWFGNTPRVLLDLRGAEAAKLMPKVEAAIDAYPYDEPGEYRAWPGPNSNTFTASVLRAVPELGITLPSNAIGRDFRAGASAGLTASGTGVEVNLYGLLGAKIAWVEGIEVNLLGLVAGLDLREPAVKLPGFGRIALLPSHAGQAAAYAPTR